MKGVSNCGGVPQRVEVWKSSTVSSSLSQAHLFLLVMVATLIPKTYGKPTKDCNVRFMAPGMAGEIGGVSETSVKWEMRKMEQITAIKPL